MAFWSVSTLKKDNISVPIVIINAKNINTSMIVPNVKYKNYLLENGIATEEELKEIEDRSKATIDDAVEFAKESPFADGAIAFQDNYAD